MFLVLLLWLWFAVALMAFAICRAAAAGDQISVVP